MSFHPIDSAIAKITYHDSKETQFFADKDVFLKALSNCLYTLGPNPNMFQAEVINYDWDLRYQVACMYLGEFGEDPPDKQSWLAEAKDRELQRLIEAEAAKPKLEIKVLLDNGSVDGVLINNKAAPVNIEIVSCDDDYEDLPALQAYRDYLVFGNESLYSGEYNIADFMSRHDSIPDFELYYRGLTCYGLTDTQSTREYGAEICYFYEHEIPLMEFEAHFPVWCHYTELVGEHISYEEYVHLSKSIHGNPLKISKEDDVLVNDLKERLSVFRAGAGEKQIPSLDHILSDVNVRTNDRDSVPTAGESHSKTWHKLRDLT